MGELASDGAKLPKAQPALSLVSEGEQVAPEAERAERLQARERLKRLREQTRNEIRAVQEADPLARRRIERAHENKVHAAWDYALLKEQCSAIALLDEITADLRKAATVPERQQFTWENQLRKCRREMIEERSLALEDWRRADRELERLRESEVRRNPAAKVLLDDQLERAQALVERWRELDRADDLRSEAVERLDKLKSKTLRDRARRIRDNNSEADKKGDAVWNDALLKERRRALISFEEVAAARREAKQIEAEQEEKYRREYRLLAQDRYQREWEARKAERLQEAQTAEQRFADRLQEERKEAIRAERLRQERNEENKKREASEEKPR